jgi:cytochrome c oxidase subunit I
MTGKMYNEAYGRIGCLLVFIGFNMTFFNQFIIGQQGMPRRYSTYVPQFQQQHVLSTIGAYIIGTGLFFTLFYLLRSLKTGKQAPADPWGAASLEWTIQSPPIEHNFHGQPRVDGSPYDFKQIDRSGGMDAH